MSEMNSETREVPLVPFGDAESLLLHQLRLLEWMATTGRKRLETDDRETSTGPTPIPKSWQLTKGITAYKWQNDCVNKWFDHDGRGTVKVVTGGGKTLLALSIAERLQNTTAPGLRVAIVVPTIVLMHQWYDALLEHGTLPRQAIGRLGGGYDASFDDDMRILITVLASAYRQLPRIVHRANVGKQLLLIADECHRAGASEMSGVFKTERAFSLGLSATPEREDDVDTGYDESLLGREVGPIIYEFNLADAVREGLVPKFTINHLGLPMTAAERSRYESLSRSISDAMSALRSHRGSGAEGDFFSWARSVATRNKGELGSIAMRFVSDSSRRRELLNRIEARHRAVERLIEREFKVNTSARVILFHESIDEVMSLYVRLRSRGLPAIAEHSELPGSIRETGLDLFRRGVAQVIVSARSLIEGFNVPAVDVGIIVASSGSVRQRIQSLGRVLRRHRGASGEEKTSCIHVLYAAATVEEHIYSKVDWDATTGVEQNRYYRWEPDEEPQEQPGPPQTPLPTEMQVDIDTLQSGGVYPGQYEGMELSCDSQRNIRDAEGRYAKETHDLADALLRVKGTAGRFKITPKRQFVLVRVPVCEDWETRFVTQLSQPLDFAASEVPSTNGLDPTTWARTARLGDLYPFVDLKIVEDDLRFKQKGGGVVCKKIRGGELYAKTGARAADEAKGADATRIVSALQALHNLGRIVSKIEINEANHVVFREAGQSYFVCGLEKGLEFPS